jgi:hypothetical protein
MAPVISAGIDRLVPVGNQTIAIYVTLAIAVITGLLVLRFCLQQKMAWPALILVSGTITSMQEPLYDHLFGLWFFEEGQINAFTTYGIHVPLWLPVIYFAYYGCGTIWFWWQMERGAILRTIMLLYGVEVLLAGLAEMFYINFVGLYNYQTEQPFVIWNYPVFVAIINGVPPTLAAIMLYRLKPLLSGWENVLLLPLVPTAFAVGSFGSSWLYLSARHAEGGVSQPVLYLAAASAALGSIALVWCAARMAGIGQKAKPAA